MCNKANNQQTLFSRNGLRTIDKAAVEYYGIPSIVLMENAAIGASKLILDYANYNLRQNIIIVCGSGNNDGDGYSVARHLANNGCATSILQLSRPKTNDAILNATIAENMDIPISPWKPESLKSGLLIIDALLGTGIDGTVEGAYADAIAAINATSAEVVALDIPSGLDCDSGLPLGCCVMASMTVSFIGMKVGFLNKSAEKYLGDIRIADIGCPSCLVKKYGIAAT